MLLSIQFPLADIRRFLQTRTGCIDQPEWPLPAVRPEFPQNAPFVRSFGQIKPRMLGGLAFWGEDLICEATRLVRWQKPNAYAFRSNKMVLPMELAFRRFFLTGAQSPNMSWARDYRADSFPTLGRGNSQVCTLVPGPPCLRSSLF